MQTFVVGDRVKVLSNENGSSNPVGSTGVVTQIGNEDCRVVVEGVTDDNLVNWHTFGELQLLD
jgi:ribosomal protein L24